MVAKSGEDRDIHRIGTRGSSSLSKRSKARHGRRIYDAQEGDEHPRVKALKGFGGRSVLEVAEDYDGDTFRAIYTVRFAKAVYVLHAFQKKSKSGIATSRHDVELIKLRLKRAAIHYETHFGKGTGA